MNDLASAISTTKTSFETALAQISSVNDLDQLRVTYLGKKGSVTHLFAEVKNLSLDQKREVGPLLAELKSSIEHALEAKKNFLIKQQSDALQQKEINFDVTAYTPTSLTPHLHPFTQCIEEIENIFISMGFTVFDGPEVESDEYNFGALNIPENHPARDMYDTLWLDVPGMLLRTHTSTIQVHAMRNNSLPIAGIATGRVFRHEAVDASHDFMFMQCEGIMIDKKITLSHLFGVAQQFLRTLFNTNDLDIRIRPGFFPFVEPGVEIDMRCPFCKKGCSACKKTTWIEVFPGGLIHPNVLRKADIDAEEYAGFAFGFGLTRLAMMRYGVNDIRLFHSADYRFLRQF